MQISTHIKKYKTTQCIQTWQEIGFAQNCYVEMDIISGLYSAYMHMCPAHLYRHGGRALLQSGCKSTFGFINCLNSPCKRSQGNVLKNWSTSLMHNMQEVSKLLVFLSCDTLALNCSRLLSPRQRWEEILFERKHFLKCSSTRKEKKRDILNCCDSGIPNN